jgi:transcriptional regulator with XRE-family HTH domain
MPRPNPPRSIAGETALARRIAYEREKRGWSYEGLAARMTAVGCPITGSAIFKTEKGAKPRRITVDELIALGRVFEMPIQDLVVDPALDVAGTLRELVEDLITALDRMESAVALVEAIDASIMGFGAEYPDVWESVLSSNPLFFKAFGESRYLVQAGGWPRVPWETASEPLPWNVEPKEGE